MNNALLYLGGLLVAALAALFAVPHFVDWNSYRGVLEEEASRMLGRDLRVGGAVNVRFLPVPYVSFEKVRIADAGPSSGGSIARIESFTMWLSVPPLLRGVVQANHVELRKPVLNLSADGTGGGNWQSFNLNSGSVPFVPSDVALQSVNIIDGAIIMNGAGRGELARFEDINGELVADALDGPYKFKGSLTWEGELRKVRVATAKREPNGDVRIRASVDSPSSSNRYVFDGRLKNLAERIALEGELKARIAVAPPEAPGDHASDEGHLQAPDTPGAQAQLEAPSSPATLPTKHTARPSFELKAMLRGNTQSAELRDLTVTLDHVGAPQIITGSAQLAWAERTRLDVNLAAKWLDLDAIAGQSDRVPLEAAREYFGALAAALPDEADTSALLEFDQITLGGEPIGNVRLAATRTGGPLELRGVRATLPGGTRLELEGVLERDGKVPRLDGTLFVSGQSLFRFLAWGFRQPDIGAGRTDGSFALDGHFQLGADIVELDDATAEWTGTQLRGGIKLALGARRKLHLTLEGARIDAAEIKAGVVGFSTFKELLSGASFQELGATETKPLFGIDTAKSDLSIRLKISELVDGNRVLRDLDAEVQVDKGNLSLPLIRFTTPQGLFVEAEGEAKNVSERPQGTIRALVSAPNAEAVQALVELFDLPDEQARAAERISRLAPMRVAGTLTLLGDEANGAEVSLDGTVSGGRLTASAKLAGGQNAWRDAPVDFTAALEGFEPARMLVALFGVDATAEAGSSQSGRLVIKVVGTPSKGALALAELSSDPLKVSFDGRVTLVEGASPGADGELSVSGNDARALLSLAGLDTSAGASGVPLVGKLAATLRDGSLRLSSERLALGDAVLSGRLVVGAGEGQARSFEADLDLSKARLAGVLAPLLAPAAVPDPAPPAPQPARTSSRRAQPEPPEPLPVREPIWPDQSFDLALLDRVAGTVKIKIRSLEVEPGLAIENAAIAARLSRSGITVETFEGDAVGGKLRANLDFERAAAGVGLKGGLRIDIASNPAASTTPGDVAAFTTRFSGRALSPAALIAALEGDGEVALGDASIAGMSPASVLSVVEAGVSGAGPIAGEALLEATKAAVREGELKLGRIAIPVKIGNGTLALEKVQVETKEGRATFTTAVELDTMSLDSEWQVEAKLEETRGPAARAYMPPVTIVYAGKLTDFAALEPQVSIGALERELAVRKMERDVEKLEELRRADEARAAAERERRRLEEEARAREAAEEAARQAVPLDQSAPAPMPEGFGGPTQGAPPTDAAPTPAAPAAEAGVPAGAMEASQAQPEVAGTAGAEVPTPEPAPARPVRRKPRQEESWQPFSQPF